MLSRTAALSLLSIPHSSQLIQHLGPPWCDPENVAPNPHFRAHAGQHTPLTQLSKLVPPQSCRPEKFKYGPWTHNVITSDRLITNPDVPRGEDRKTRTRDIKREESDGRSSTLLLFCHGASPSDREGTPMATAACAANRRGKTIGILTEALGPYASTRDAAYKSLTLATDLAIPTLHETNSIREIKIFSTNPTLPAQCLD